MINLHIIGAFDRFNYGDMLFPIIIEYMLKERLNKKTKFEFYGIRESDLSKYGGKKTMALKNIPLDTRRTNYYINAGGNTLAAEISMLYLDNIDNKFVWWINILFRKVIGHKNYLQYVIKKTGISNIFPYDILSNKMFYNGVGGDLNSLTEQRRHYINHILEDSPYIAVRDKNTFDSILSNEKKLIPDTAIILSDIWRKSTLKLPKCMDISNSYIVFQVSGGFYHRYKKEIIKKLSYMRKEIKCRIILLPIGYAISHGDKEALKNIKNIYEDFIFCEDLSLQEITAVICNAKLFIGTSLHGNLISFSYKVPSILLANIDTKNEIYYRTWLRNTSVHHFLPDIFFSQKNGKFMSFEFNCEDELIKQKRYVYRHFEYLAKIINKFID